MEVHRSSQIASTAVASRPRTRGTKISSRQVLIVLTNGAVYLQITHADDAAAGLEVKHQDVAHVAESVALEPRILRPRHAQLGHADGFNRHVGHCTPPIGATWQVHDGRRYHFGKAGANVPRLAPAAMAGYRRRGIDGSKEVEYGFAGRRYPLMP